MKKKMKRKKHHWKHFCNVNCFIIVGMMIALIIMGIYLHRRNENDFMKSWLKGGAKQEWKNTELFQKWQGNLK